MTGASYKTGRAKEKWRRRQRSGRGGAGARHTTCSIPATSYAPLPAAKRTRRLITDASYETVLAKERGKRQRRSELGSTRVGHTKCLIPASSYSPLPAAMRTRRLMTGASYKTGRAKEKWRRRQRSGRGGAGARHTTCSIPAASYAPLPGALRTRRLMTGASYKTGLARERGKRQRRSELGSTRVRHTKC